MRKFSLCIFVVGALFGGAASSWSCTVQKIAILKPSVLFLQPVSACQNLTEKFEKVRRDLKECTARELNIDKMESLFQDFCTPGSNLRRSVDKNMECFLRHSPSGIGCVEKIRDGIQRMPSEGYTVEEICARVPKYAGSCEIKMVGKPCGEGGMKAYQRIIEASEPFLEELCLEIIEETAKKRKEETIERSEYEAEFSGASANYVLLWSILLGVLLAIKWYR